VVWDLKSGQTLRTLQGHDDLVTAVAVLPDGDHVASASLDQALRLWDLENGERISSFAGDSGRFSCVSLQTGGR
jgi:WD40 repeat protein